MIASTVALIPPDVSSRESPTPCPFTPSTVMSFNPTTISIPPYRLPLLARIISCSLFCYLWLIYALYCLFSRFPHHVYLALMYPVYCPRCSTIRLSNVTVSEPLTLTNTL